MKYTEEVAIQPALMTEPDFEELARGLQLGTGGGFIYRPIRVVADALRDAYARGLAAGRQEALKPYRWRPIAEIHEDCGECVLMNIAAPGGMEIGSNLDVDFNESLWSHFAEVPKLTTEEAGVLIAALGAPE